ncbi:hypothetical protein ACQJBY_045569 [Aegilops geniculata]
MASESHGMDRRRWSDLPADVLREISGRVRDAAGFVSFHAVCKQWRDPLYRARATRTQFLPWLLAPPDQQPGHLKFRCVFSKASYRVVPPSPVPRRNWVCKTDGAGVWYLAVDERLRPNLHDPLTGAVAHLPTFPWGQWFNPCGVIYDDGTTFLYSVDHVVVGGNESGWFRAALLRPGDAEWTAVQRTLEAPWIWYREFCATYHGGKIMVTVDDSLWHVVTPDGGDDVLAPRPPREEGPYSRQYSHVLESRGELLWVLVQVQSRSYTSMSGLRPVFSMVVHALGEETTSPEKKTRWVRKDGHSLTDRVLFLGWPNSFAMDASRLSGRVDGGCVYFVYREREEVGVFRYSLVDDKIKYWYYGRQNNLEIIERLPQGLGEGRCTWLLPQPAIAPIQELNERALKAQELKQQPI